MVLLASNSSIDGLEDCCGGWVLARACRSPCWMTFRCAGPGRSSDSVAPEPIVHALPALPFDQQASNKCLQQAGLGAACRSTRSLLWWRPKGAALLGFAPFEKVKEPRC